MGEPPLLATKSGISVVVALLLQSGAMCEQCGFGTRVTSKRWARCKRCGHRNRRMSMTDAADALLGKPVAGSLHDER